MYPSQPQPTVGRIVHYQAHGSPNGQHKSLPRAAIVTETAAENPELYTDPMTIGLCVLNPTGQYFNRETPYSETPKAGHWSWPPRV